MMRIDRIDDIRRARRASGRLYEEFLRVRSLSAGLYELPVGATDPQRPHAEDEVYYVIAGTAEFVCEGESQPVGAGDVVYVEAGAEHRFVNISRDLSLLVFFAPAESG